MNVIHLTSVHQRNDTRIFIKECRSLAQRGHTVTLIVADGNGNDQRDGVRIVDVGRAKGRLNRMWKTTQQLFDNAVKLDANVYHLHDPELIPVGLKLKRLRKKVVFDSHEDVPKQILAKPYLGRFSQHVLSDMVGTYERYACSRFDGIIGATPFIRDKFLRINPRTVDVNNFPLIGELDAGITWKEKRQEVCYIGSISIARGILKLMQACQYLRSDARLNLGGEFANRALAEEVRTYPGWSRVNELGFLDRPTVRNIMGASVAGLVVLQPVTNYLDALPVKMFEYMAAGIPVIASDFPLLRKVIEDHHCGLCVDPNSPRAIANAIDYLVMHPEVAQAMGERGRKAVFQQYNWSVEEEKLGKFYAELACA